MSCVCNEGDPHLRPLQASRPTHTHTHTRTPPHTRPQLLMPKEPPRVLTTHYRSASLTMRSRSNSHTSPSPIPDTHSTKKTDSKKVVSSTYNYGMRFLCNYVPHNVGLKFNSEVALNTVLLEYFDDEKPLQMSQSAENFQDPLQSNYCILAKIVI